MLYTDALNKLKEETDINSLSEGEYVLTGPCVCQSAAGFYIGQWCLERSGDFFIPQPYDRLSGYMTKEQALLKLADY